MTTLVQEPAAPKSNKLKSWWKKLKSKPERSDAQEVEPNGQALTVDQTSNEEGTCNHAVPAPQEHGQANPKLKFTIDYSMVLDAYSPSKELPAIEYRPASPPQKALPQIPQPQTINDASATVQEPAFETKLLSAEIDASGTAQELRARRPQVENSSTKKHPSSTPREVAPRNLQSPAVKKISPPIIELPQQSAEVQTTEEPPVSVQELAPTILSTSKEQGGPTVRPKSPIENVKEGHTPAASQETHRQTSKLKAIEYSPALVQRLGKQLEATLKLRSSSSASQEPTSQPETSKMMLFAASKRPKASKPKDPPPVIRPPRVLERHFETCIQQNTPLLIKLPMELWLHVSSYLDYAGTILMKLTCKQINSLLSLPKAIPMQREKLALLRNLPPKMYIPSTSTSRSPPYLCNRCCLWHSYEHLVLFPIPKPESAYVSYAAFAAEPIRTCARFWVKNRNWIPGHSICEKYILCAYCLTPSNTYSNRCQWNCKLCFRCTNRKAWSGYCTYCWKPRDPLEMGYEGWLDPRVDKGRRKGSKGLNRNGSSEDGKGRICGKCLGLLTYVKGSNDMCRCGEDRHSFEG